MLSPSGPSTIAGNSVRTSTSRVMSTAARTGASRSRRRGPARPRPSGGLGRVRGRAVGDRLPLGRRVRRPAVPRPDVVRPRPVARRARARRGRRSSRPARARARCTMPRTPGTSSSPRGPADDEHLGAARAVEVDDPAQVLAVGRAHGQALELVQQPAAGLARLVGHVDLEVDVAQRLGARRGRGPRGTAATSRGRPRRARPRRWSARGCAPSGYSDGAHDEALLRAVREELDADLAAQAAQAAHEADGEPRGSAGVRPARMPRRPRRARPPATTRAPARTRDRPTASREPGRAP